MSTKMTCNAQYSLSERNRSVGEQIHQLLRRVGDAVGQWRRNAESRRILLQLNDCQLHDIGLTRHDLGIDTHDKYDILDRTRSGFPK